MLSRVKTLDGLAIYRSFPHDKLKYRQSEELRNEFERLSYLEHQTTTDIQKESELLGLWNFQICIFSTGTDPTPSSGSDFSHLGPHTSASFSYTCILYAWKRYVQLVMSSSSIKDLHCKNFHPIYVFLLKGIEYQQYFHPWGFDTSHICILLWMKTLTEPTFPVWHM